MVISVILLMPYLLHPNSMEPNGIKFDSILGFPGLKNLDQKPTYCSNIPSQTYYIPLFLKL